MFENCFFAVSFAAFQVQFSWPFSEDQLSALFSYDFVVGLGFQVRFHLWGFFYQESAFGVLEIHEGTFAFSNGVILRIDESFDHFIAAAHVIFDGGASFSGKVIDGVGFEDFGGFVGLVDNGDDIVEFFYLLADEFSFDWYDKIVDVDVSLDTFFQQYINGYDGKHNNSNSDTAVYKVEHDGLVNRVSD